ncbi:hypothetical protein A3H80_01785 [Candidatus Roizmanbacteria bacterium RIFCSPLOWO2_02_FULL_37_19]|uniref:Uncharacterized protein n=1 Tax=Candidatus Roizmanbacteria bacterium RIFCSPHIGHO2_02_FULL_37_24 TaxID=1802037 RepID=A0A1F7GY65_9BACT|nr:MAG: hypothetical protein A2862_02435 [Candidatus Roizmanbacteria bacterium RIFCSPHIGHO2_01_FULL_38_41]OGK23506.1 MAG: hypothetical protein A3C24_01785 [Candidatus Roizmanbacteria bacterium RIFCSPHIGHO2_02_FULL_37_24]OGK33464.1 MAG: hypothetical protein A3E10_02500 [Candidatus Roizmanbacteria bacterium RIFCSPHIGHO2_12_FULL_37_23]OGK45383.1 MAG: hypothetical protein A2956_04130 [Candidatus Roizmanbacteria bacterium RIFCSPLOWO2_01_FULL_37_57]OGK54042.1 MAG: hypothetical protein A3H80_01785 [Ca
MESKLQLRNKIASFTLILRDKISFLPKKLVIIVVIGLIIIVSLVSYTYVLKDLPDPRGLRNYGVIPLSTQIYDRNGKLLYDIFRDQNRTPVKLKNLPVYVPQATIAIEDANFYKHSGISIFGGILRAVKDTLLGNSKRVQGGSTITQQLVKSALLSPERTIRRKLKEVVLAVEIEQLLSKDEILELYLNQVPYGGVSYGIQEAARSYFDKDAKDLGLHEAALLAGLPRAPTTYNPYTNFDRAKARQKEVLKRMEELDYITNKQRIDAEKKELDIRPPETSIKAPHFVFYVRSILEKEYGKELVEEGGLKVVTTLDYDLQASSEAILKEEVDDIRHLKVTNGALLATRPSTGEILTMVGSVDFFAEGSGSYNVTTANRQPGSSIKPITYALALEKKIINPASVLIDGPSCFIAEGQPKAYCPGNYDGSFRGPIQVRFALANSLNIPAVRTMAKLGVEEFVASSPAFLIKSLKDPKNYGLSLTLGGGEIPMVQMAQAFSAFANEGVPRELVAILKVTDKNGKTIYEYKDPNFAKDIHKTLQYPNFLGISGKRALSKETAFLISHILLDNGARSQAFGTSSNLVIKGKTVSVKTGTTNDYRDNWTIGYTPNFLVATWVGNNDNTPMSYLASGITGAAPIWNRVMSILLEEQPDLWPRQPEGVVGRQVCSVSGLVPSSASPHEGEGGCPTRFEFMLRGTENVGAGVIAREFIPVNRDTGFMTKADDPSAEMREQTVISDGLSKYCLDCTHEHEPAVTVNVFKQQDTGRNPNERRIE